MVMLWCSSMFVARGRSVYHHYTKEIYVWDNWYQFWHSIRVAQIENQWRLITWQYSKIQIFWDIMLCLWVGVVPDILKDRMTCTTLGALAQWWHSVTSQKTSIFSSSAVITSNLAQSGYTMHLDHAFVLWVIGRSVLACKSMPVMWHAIHTWSLSC
jgi:hypothetical protein